jgi:general secretion pathway protein A
MYKNFFGLRENPFDVNPDPRFLYLTPQIQEAVDVLTYGIQNRKGFILLSGEVGTGKTTLINYLLNWLRQRNTPTAFIFNSHLSINHLFDFILTDFGVPIDFRLKSNMLMGLNTWLIERYRRGETPVLIVDEAQGLSFELLEEVRLLLNLETASEKLLQIVLVGQSEVEEKLNRPELRQLRQRITLRCKTAPLTLEESHGYIAERLRIGGAMGDPIFASDAMDAVHHYSQGIPRVMNLLCEHSLINAYVEQFNPVPVRMVEEAARDFLLDEFHPFTAHSSFRNPMNSNLSVMQSMSAKELERPFTMKKTSLLELLQTTWPPAAAALALEEPALAAESSFVTSVPESGESLNVSVSVNDWIPALPVPEPMQGDIGLRIASTACLTDSAAQLITEMERNLAVFSSIPGLPLIPPKRETDRTSAANGNPISAAKSGALSLESTKRISRDICRTWIRALLSSLRARRIAWETDFSPAILSTAWSRVSNAVPWRNRKSTHAGQVLQHWIFEFKRDWISMINAIASAQLKRSLLCWLRQSGSSKSMASSKNQPV